PGGPRRVRVRRVARPSRRGRPPVERARGARAGLLGQPLAERDRTLPGNPPRHREDAHPHRSRSPRRPAGRRAAMSGPDFDELVDNDLTEEERERLEGVHELLVAAGPLPELPPYLEHLSAPEPAEVVPFFNRRRSAVAGIAAAAIAAAAFGGGYL